MPTYFGTEGQRMIGRKADLLWPALRDDPRFHHHGRAIGVHAGLSADLSPTIALARTNGASAYVNCPNDRVEQIIAALAAAGLVTDHYSRWVTGEESLARANAILNAHSMPEDLSIERIEPDTLPDTLDALDQLAQTCDVFLPHDGILRGIDTFSVCLMALDQSGKPVGMATAIAGNHPQSGAAHVAQWGMLATAPERRGQKIGLLMGATSLHAALTSGRIIECSTGIRAGNAPSEGLCRQLGLAPSGCTDIIAIDPAAFGGSQITK